MENKRSNVWLYFDAKEDEKAECRYCRNILSIKGGSSGNLLRHLKKKHMVFETSPESQEMHTADDTLPRDTSSPTSKKTAKKRSAIWDHYNIMDKERVQCRYCETILSIKGSVTSLLRHMRSRHTVVEITPRMMIKDASPPKIKVDRKRSSVWNHFTAKEDRAAECRYCKSIIRGSSGNLFRHLKNRHETVEISTEAIPEQESAIIGIPQRDESVPMLSTSPARSASPASGLVSVFADELEASVVESVALPEIDFALFSASGFSFTPPSSSSQRPSSGGAEVVSPILFETSKKIDDQLLKLIVKEYRPFSIVEGIEFQEFVHLLCPGYALPSRKTLTNNTMPMLYRRTVEKVKCQLRKCVAVALRTGTLTSTNKASFITVTAHFLDGETQMKSFLLGCIEFGISHTSINISIKLKKLCEEWDIQNKVIAVVTDNAVDMVAAVQEINFRHLPCFAQTVNSIVDHSIKKISSTLNKCKSVVQLFKPSSLALAKLNEVQAQMNVPILKLKQSDSTTWNSSFEMLEGFLENIEPLISTLESLQVEEKLKVSTEDWRIIEQAVTMLRVFYEITEEMSVEKGVSLSKTILLKHIMKSRVEFFLQNYYLEAEIADMGHELLHQISGSFEDWDSFDLITETTLLDPRFKNYGFGGDESSYWEAYNSLVIKLEAVPMADNDNEVLSTSSPRKKVQDFPKTSLWDQFDEEVNELAADENLKAAGVVELERFRDEPLLERSGNPLEWWNHRRMVYPKLYELVLKRLCIPATSFPSERIFSKDANTLTEKRNRLLSKNLSMILFLNHNLNCNNNT